MYYTKSVLLAALFTCFLVFESMAQVTYRSSKDDKDKKEFKDQLWYGGGLNLNFFGVNGNNAFLVGISPIVGYKFYGPFSIGPRVGFNYVLQRVNLGNRFDNVSLFEVEPAMFLRSKIYQGFFAHGETGLLFQQNFEDVNGGFDKFWNRFNTTYLGLGYNNARGKMGYDIYLLWDFELAKVSNNANLPLQYRFGFTYNF